MEWNGMEWNDVIFVVQELHCGMFHHGVIFVFVFKFYSLYLH